MCITMVPCGTKCIRYHAVYMLLFSVIKIIKDNYELRVYSSYVQGHASISCAIVCWVFMY